MADETPPGPAESGPIMCEGRRLGERRFEVAEGIWRMPIPTGYSAGDVNLYWLDGEDPILIDTGVLGDASFDHLCRALESGGRRVEDVRTLLLTHSHVDHAANAWRIREASGCDVRVRRRAVRRLSDVEAASEADVPGIVAFLGRCGFSEETVRQFGWFIQRMRRISHSCPGVAGIDDGDVVVGGGGRSIRVHARPGHSSSDLVYEVVGTGILVTGDQIGRASCRERV